MNAIRNAWGNRRGFTLVEIVITIGIIAIVSGFILQLFITAKNLNQKAYDLDKGIMFSTSLIEMIKSEKTLDAIKGSSLLDNASIEQSGSEIKISQRYDSDWMVQADKTTPAAYTLTGELKPSATGLYKIHVSVVKVGSYMMENKPNKEIYTIDASRYFGN